MAHNDVLDEIPLDATIEQRLTVFREQVVELEQQSRTIRVADDVGEQAALIFIAGVKQVSNDLEEYRDGLVRPHNTTVKKINASVRDISDLTSRLIDAMDRERSVYLTEKERKIEEANRLAAAEAERVRLEKEAKEKAQREAAEAARLEVERLERERIEAEIKAEQERQELERQRREEEAAAEAARLAGDRAAQEAAEQRAAAMKAAEAARIAAEEETRRASLAAQAKLEKKAITLEAKADIAAMEAEVIAPMIQFNDSSGVRVLSNGVKVGTREVKEIECWETGALLYRDPVGKKSRRYNEFDGNSSCVPEELKDFKQYGYLWKFDIAAAVALAKKGHPVPGLSSTTRKKTVGSR